MSPRLSHLLRTRPVTGCRCQPAPGARPRIWVIGLPGGAPERKTAERAAQDLVGPSEGKLAQAVVFLDEPAVVHAHQIPAHALQPLGALGERAQLVQMQLGQ